MKISARHQAGVTILEPKGKITIGVGDVALREAVHEAVEAGSRRILIDLGGVSTIDSSGIGELVAACLSGVLSVEHALALVAERGRLMEAAPDHWEFLRALRAMDTTPWYRPDPLPAPAGGAAAIA